MGKPADLKRAMSNVDALEEGAANAVEEALAQQGEAVSEPVEPPPQVALTTTQQAGLPARPGVTVRTQALCNEMDMKRHSAITFMEETRRSMEQLQIEHEEEMAERHRVFVDKMAGLEEKYQDAERERIVLDAAIEQMRGMLQ